MILVDGIPGSGKSTTAYYLERFCRAAGLDARWYHELEADNPLFSEEYIETRTIDNADQFIKETLQKWKNLVDRIKNSKTIYIIEGYLLQGTVGALFDNAVEEAVIKDYADQVATILKEIKPSVIYFSPENVYQNLLDLVQIRDPEWIRSRGKSIISSKYAMKHKLSGYEGWVEMLTKRAKLADKIVEAFHFSSLVLDSTGKHWGAYLDRISDFVGLNPVRDPKPKLTIVEQLEGRYRQIKSDTTCHIVNRDGDLYLCGFFPAERKLIPSHHTVYDIVGNASELKSSSESGEIEILIDTTRLYQGQTYEFVKI